MSTPSKKTRALVLASALAASVCACKERSRSEPRAEPAGASEAGTAPSPALWEPIDENFKGCEGG